MLPAQHMVWERVGVENQYQLGFWTANVGDIDGDGWDDILHLGQDLTGTATIEHFLLSSRDGSSIRTWVSPQRTYRGVSAAGDVNADGVPDYAVSLWAWPNANFATVEVRSGIDDALLWSVQGTRFDDFGAAILGDVDLDGDSRPDLLVTGPDQGSWGIVYAYRHDGTALPSYLGTSQLSYGFSSRSCLGRIGDFDGDGADDFVLGAFDWVAGLTAAVVVSGDDGQILQKGHSPSAFETVGHAVDGAGDMDGDGVLDFVGSSDGGPGEVGVVVAYSGADARPLQTWWSGDPTRNFGKEMKSGGQDFDQDGVPDVVIGASLIGSVFVVSGRDGSLIHRVDTTEPGITWLGTYISVVPPQPGHSFPLVVLPEGNYCMYAGQTGSRLKGRIRLYRGNPDGVDYLGDGCQGTLAAAPRIGVTDRGSNGLRIHLSNTPPGSTAFLLLGAGARTNTVLGSFAPSGEAMGSPAGGNLLAASSPLSHALCSLYVPIQFVSQTATGLTDNTAGYTFLDTELPLAAPGNGVFTLNAQWFVTSRTGRAMSGGLSWRH